MLYPIPAEDMAAIAALLEQGREGLGERVARRTAGIPGQLGTLVTALPLNLAAIALGMSLWRGGMLRGEWRTFRLQRIAGLAALVALPGLLLLAAWLEASPLHSGLLMLAFGLGTLPLMTTLSYSGARFQNLLGHRGLRTGLAVTVFISGVLTAAAPWLMHAPGMHGLLTALGCRSLV